MEIVSQPGYKEEVPMHRLNAAEYLMAAQKAIVRLGWRIVAIDRQSVVCQTAIGDDLNAETIKISVNGKAATFESVPYNEYYWDNLQGLRTIASYKKVIEQVAEEREKANRNLHPMHREKYGALVPSKSYLVTPFIVYTNVLVFIAMLFAGISPLQPTTQSLFEWGGNFRPADTQGEWWRLLTYMFLHGGAMHLLMNTYALLYIGMFLEPLMGRFRFISAYILTGVCAGLMSIAMHPFSVGVGASGAIFGMYGVFLSMLTTSHIQKTMRKTMLRSILFFVVFNLMAGLQGNVDNAAHIGGLLSGLIIGYVYYPGIAAHSPLRKQLVVTGVVASFVVGVVVFVLAFLQ